MVQQTDDLADLFGASNVGIDLGGEIARDLFLGIRRRWGRFSVQQLKLGSFFGRLGAVADSQLEEQLLVIPFDRVYREIQAGGDLAIR